MIRAPHYCGHQEWESDDAHWDCGRRAGGADLGDVWARAGHEVAFGSRDPARAAEAVTGLAGAHATTQEEAAAFGEVVLWTPRGVMPPTPTYSPERSYSTRTTASPVPAGGYASPRPEGPSFAEQLQAAAPRARVVKAFNTVVMRLLKEDPERLRSSGAQVFLAGDDAEAKTVAAALAADIGLVRWISGGWKRRGWRRRWPTHSAKP